MAAPSRPPRTILGGISPATFLRTYWQKRPLLVRGAVPGFAGLVDVDELAALAGRDDVQSRLVVDHAASHPGRGRRAPRRGRWELHDGPLLGLDVDQMPARGWTFLVQGLEALVPGGWDLLRRFDFLPAARVDDVMVSWAAPGGSVGPHDDLYDVFLLQGPGRRRWQIAERYDRTVDEGEPIKVLTRFEAEQDLVLEPGDMLYLPPRVAHWGTAIDACFTYSIGFLAPSHEQLLQNFLAFLGQKLAATMSEAELGRLYEDPDLKLPSDRLALGDDMVRKVARVLERARFGASDVEEFLGRFLTGAKPNVRFDAPARPLSVDAFGRRLQGKGSLRLALPTRGLVRGDTVFWNGEMRALPKKDLPVVRSLLDERALPLPVRVQGATALALWELYAGGGLLLGR